MANDAYEQSLTGNMLGKVTDEEHAAVDAITKKGRGRPKKAVVPTEEPATTTGQTFKEFITEQGVDFTKIKYGTPLHKDMLSKYEESKNTGINKVLPLIVASAGLVSLASLLPSDADAGVVQSAEKLLVHPFLGKAHVFNAGTRLKEMVGEFISKGMYSPEVNPAKGWEFPGFMHVPQIIPDIQQLVYRGGSSSWTRYFSFRSS